MDVNEETTQHALAELQSLAPLQLELQPIEAFFLVAQLQLALRHPGNIGIPAQAMHELARAIQSRLQGPHLTPLIEAGWDRQHDIPTVPRHRHPKPARGPSDAA